jgi:acrylyl-CoA reductase (NADPH)
MPDDFRCWYVTEQETGDAAGGIERRPVDELPDGDVLIRVAYSSLNYKDALAATGHRGVVKSLPHVPGIDAAGVVIESDTDGVSVGANVLVTGYGMGAERWGGWGEFVRVPGEWVVPLPAGFTAERAMQYGTAGFTAARGVDLLRRNRVEPDDGDVVVTGATGGVGIVAVMLLAKLGYRVTAVSGKQDEHDLLRELGAAEVIGREAVDDISDRALLRGRWAGGIDTVGGNTLATLLRSTGQQGCIAACGLVGGTDLPLTVYPFILRGISLAGIDSALTPYADRVSIWERLAGDWNIDGLARISRTVPLSAVDESVRTILAGEIVGRTVVDVSS